MLDENHRRVASAVVVFTLPNHGTGGTFGRGAQTVTVTDVEGRAVAQGLRVNRIAGRWQMRVSTLQDIPTGSVTVTQTNAAVGIFTKTIAVVAGAAAAGGAVAANRSGWGSSNSALAVPTTISAGTGTVGQP
jgi:hypothetical protein